MYAGQYTFPFSSGGNGNHNLIMSTALPFKSVYRSITNNSSFRFIIRNNNGPPPNVGKQMNHADKVQFKNTNSGFSFSFFRVEYVHKFMT